MSASLEEQYRNSRNLRARASLHERFSTPRQPWFEWVFERLDLRVGWRVLEVGCGTGSLWEENREHLPASLLLVLSDRSPGMVREAVDRTGLPGVVADAQALPFEDQTFDLVVANHMLYHVADLDRAIAELHRVLRRGGRLAAAANGEGHMAELKDLVVTARSDEVYWSSRFSLENGAELLDAFFERISVVHYEDVLEVTDVEAAVAYLASYLDLGSQADVERLRSRLAEDIEGRGSFRITKEVGLFLGVR